MSTTKSGKLDYTFKLRDMTRSWISNHKKIKRLRQKGIKYRDVVDPYFKDRVLRRIQSHTHWNLWWLQEIKKPLRQSDLRMLKTWVNYQTRAGIQEGLTSIDQPPYLDTAFYLEHYSIINKMMASIAKELVKSL